MYGPTPLPKPASLKLDRRRRTGRSDDGRWGVHSVFSSPKPPAERSKTCAPFHRTTRWLSTTPGRGEKSKVGRYFAPGCVATVWPIVLGQLVFSSTCCWPSDG